MCLIAKPTGSGLIILVVVYGCETLVCGAYVFGFLMSQKPLGTFV